MKGVLSTLTGFFQKKGSGAQTSEAYRSRVEMAIQEACVHFGPPSPVCEACVYTLKSGGKRFRPTIVLMVADALKSKNTTVPAALAIEYFHTASLVADDLPCMDDDDVRRNQPSTHKKYGESIALLASYALIAEGYRKIAENIALANLTNRLAAILLECASINTGLYGATGGQFLDIQPPNLSLETLRDIIHKKTVSLFEIAFVFGWLFGGGSLEKLPHVKKLASHFGCAFQIADDIEDVEADALSGRRVNVAGVFGVEKAQQLLKEEAQGYLKMLATLGIESTPLKNLINPFNP